MKTIRMPVVVVLATLSMMCGSAGAAEEGADWTLRFRDYAGIWESFEAHPPKPKDPPSKFNHPVFTRLTFEFRKDGTATMLLVSERFGTKVLRGDFAIGKKLLIIRDPVSGGRADFFYTVKGDQMEVHLQEEDGPSFKLKRITRPE